MSEYLSDRVPDQMPEYVRQCQIICQNICQIECQNRYQIKCKHICQITCQRECDIKCFKQVSLWGSLELEWFLMNHVNQMGPSTTKTVFNEWASEWCRVFYTWRRIRVGCQIPVITFVQLLELSHFFIDDCRNDYMHHVQCICLFEFDIFLWIIPTCLDNNQMPVASPGNH